MITKQVTKVMAGALSRFAKEHDVECNNIQIIMHTKNEELDVEYFYLKDGVPVTDENGEVKALTFLKDILGAKMDFLNRSQLTNMFMKTYFKETSEKHNIETNNIYFMISCRDKEAEDIYVVLFNGDSKIEELTLKDMFDKEDEQPTVQS